MKAPLFARTMSSRLSALDKGSRDSLSSPERAQQRVDFFDTYRSYVINYNLGKDLVREYVERDTEDHAARWQKFEYLLSSPMSTEDLL